MRYGDKHIQQLFRTQLRGRMQRPGETLQELEADIQKLVYLSYPDVGKEFLDEIIADSFMGAIRDPEVRQTVRLEGKKTGSEALAYALMVESARVEARPYTSHARELKVKDTKPEKPERLENMFKQILEALKPSPNVNVNTSRRGKPRCWKCDKEGHFQKDCRVRITTTTTSRGEDSNNQGKRSGASLEGRKLVQSSEVPEVIIPVSQLQKSQQSLFIQGKINGNADALSRRPCSSDC